VVRIVKHISDDGKVDFEFIGLESWEDFDTLLSILETNMNAKIISKLEGIYSRHCILEIENITFKLMYHEDMGNCLCPSHNSEEEIKYLENLAHNMLSLIRNYL